MGSPRHLSRAPLREALIDIQFEKTVPLEVIRGFSASLGETFGKSKDIWQTTLGIQFEESQGASALADNIIVGTRVDSITAPHVVQLRTQGFTFSRLQPYDSWRDLSGSGRALWQKFVSHAGIRTVSRVALRYINELRLPRPVTDFGDYLTVPPIVPAALPQSIAGFVQRTIIVNPALNCTGVVTQALEDNANAGLSDIANVVLDIDVFREDRLGLPVDDISAVLELLHRFKNDVFFDYLTEKSLELYA